MMNLTTKLRPIDFTKKNEKQLWLKHYGKHWNNQPKANLKVGQKVRISKYKHVFARGFLPQFTLEIFLIARVAAKLSKTMYYLQDLNKEPIEGGFYREEIVPVVKEDDVYHISKILKHRTYKGQKQLLVQWQGYGKEFDSWIPATNIVST